MVLTCGAVFQTHIFSRTNFYGIQSHGISIKPRRLVFYELLSGLFKKNCSRGGRYQLDSSLVRLRTASYISTGTQNSFSINSYLSRCFPSKPGASRSNPARFHLILLPIEGKRKKKSCLKQEARRQFTLNHTKHCLLKMGGKARSQRVEWIKWRC